MPTDDSDKLAQSVQEIVETLDRVTRSLDAMNKNTEQLLAAINANAKATNDLLLLAAKDATSLKLVPRLVPLNDGTYEATWIVEGPVVLSAEDTRIALRPEET